MIIVVFRLPEWEEEVTLAAPCAHAVAVKDIARLDASELPQEHLYTGDYIIARSNLVRSLLFSNGSLNLCVSLVRTVRCGPWSFARDRQAAHMNISHQFVY